MLPSSHQLVDLGIQVHRCGAQCSRAQDTNSSIRTGLVSLLWVTYFCLASFHLFLLFMLHLFESKNGVVSLLSAHGLNISCICYISVCRRSEPLSRFSFFKPWWCHVRLSKMANCWLLLVLCGGLNRCTWMTKSGWPRTSVVTTWWLIEHRMLGNVEFLQTIETSSGT